MIAPTPIAATVHHLVHGYPMHALGLSAASRVLFHPEARDLSPNLRHVLKTLPVYYELQRRYYVVRP